MQVSSENSELRLEKTDISANDTELPLIHMESDLLIPPEFSRGEKQRALGLWAVPLRTRELREKIHT